MGHRAPDGPGSADEIVVEGRPFTVARARLDDVPALVSLLAEDPLGSRRETADPATYEEAFHAIDEDHHQYLAAVRDAEGTLAGTMQLTLIPGLSRGAVTRLQIEAVRVARSARGSGLGAAMFEWAHAYGRRHGAGLAQLTTDRTRTDAHRFYARLGYASTHEGLKLSL
jgi:GNAT superfamily N-acetyltransferase